MTPDTPATMLAPSLELYSPLALHVRRAGGQVVGRPFEMAAIEQELSSSAAGRLAAVTLEGEPGIGKTRLLVAAAEAATRAGFLAVAVTADEEIRGPFLVARAIFGDRQARQAAAGTEAGEALDRAAAALVGVDDPGLAAMPRDERLLRTFDLGAVALRALAGERPVALLVDDLQWADQDSIRLLRYLVRAGVTAPIFLLFAIRPEETAEVSEIVNLIADMERMGLVRRLHLARFTQVETGLFLRQLLGGEVDGPGVATVHAQAEGVPFIIEELAQAYRDGGMLQEIDGVWRIGRGAERLVPSAVRTLIQRRAARLPDATRGALAEAAVVGRSFSLRDLRAVKVHLGDPGAEADDLAGGLAPAVAAGLLVQHPEGSAADYTFTHEQVREFATAALTVPRRRAIHGAIVDILTAGADTNPACFALLAQHALAAGDAARGARYSVEAARVSLESNAPDEALRLIDTALQVAADPQDRLTLLRFRDDALDVLRRSSDRLEALAEMGALAEALGDEQAQLDVMLRRAAALRHSEDLDGAARVAAEVRRRATERGDRATELAACLELGQDLVGAPLGEAFVLAPGDEVDIEAADEAYGAAASFARELGDERALAAATRELGVLNTAKLARAFFEVMASGEMPENLLMHPPIGGNFMMAQSRFEEALGIFERLDDRRGVMSTIIAMAYTNWGPDVELGSAKRIEEIRRLSTRFRSLRTESERQQAEVQMLYGVHVYARAYGFPDLALQRGEEGYRLAKLQGDRTVEFLSAGGMALQHLELGEVEEAERWLDRAAAAASAAPTPLRARQLEMWRGLAAAGRGEAEAMRRHLERAVDQASDHGRPAARCEALAALAVAAARVGADRGDGDLLALAERSADAVLQLAAGLPGNPSWPSEARAALAQVALAGGDVAAAAEHARAVIDWIENDPHIRPLALDMRVMAERAMLFGGTDEERAALRARAQRLVGTTAERVLDEGVRVRWLRAPLQRELVEMAGGVETSLELVRSSPLFPVEFPEPEGVAAEMTEEDSRLLMLLIEGRTNREIAEALDTDEEQVTRRLGELFGRIGASSQADVVAFAFRARVV
ncbi:MAG: AAA family ATPase [Actinobacteria bacterium]|nr:AAA family ATPase [Actinomycetota bacterium]